MLESVGTGQKIEIGKIMDGRFRSHQFCSRKKLTPPGRRGGENSFLPQRKQKYWGPKPHDQYPTTRGRFV